MTSVERAPMPIELNPPPFVAQGVGGRGLRGRARRVRARYDACASCPARAGARRAMLSALEPAADATMALHHAESAIEATRAPLSLLQGFRADATPTTRSPTTAARRRGGASGGGAPAGTFKTGTPRRAAARGAGGAGGAGGGERRRERGRRRSASAAGDARRRREGPAARREQRRADRGPALRSPDELERVARDCAAARPVSTRARRLSAAGDSFRVADSCLEECNALVAPRPPAARGRDRHAKTRDDADTDARAQAAAPRGRRRRAAGACATAGSRGARPPRTRARPAGCPRRSRRAASATRR